MNDLKGVTHAMTSWSVEDAPATLHPPRVEAPARTLRLLAFSWRPSYLVLTFGGAAVTLMLVTNLASFAKRERSLVAKPHIVAGQSALPDGPLTDRNGRLAGRGGAVDKLSTRAQLSQTERQPSGGGRPEITVAEQVNVPAARSLIRTATLRLVARDFDAVRPAVEKLAADAGGFIDQMTAAGSPGAARTLTGTLRVPASRLPDALARLRQLGQVTEDTQGAEDVTDQVVDLDARLSNARATEQRLNDILKNRTGKLSDVLDVERELARVRLEIEQMDAQRANIGRRVTYAAVTIDISEERKAGLDGPLSLATRIRIAAADGVQSAFDTVVGAMLFVLSAGPTLVLLLFAGALVWAAGRRIVRATSSSTPRASG
jgi:hypothetical protein